MRRLKRFLLGLFAVLALASAVVHFAPLDAYVPEVEQRLGGLLHEKVGIRQLRLAMLPLPHLEFLDVSVGGQDGIAARSADVQLDLPALLAGKLAVRRILIKDGAAHFAQVRKLVALFADPSAATQNVALRELQFSGMSLIVPGMALGPLEGRLEFASAGRLKLAWFATEAQKATVTLLPQPDRRFSLVVQAHEWVPPQFPLLPLDDMQLVGVVGEREVVVQKFSATSRGLRAAGSGKVDFADGWRIEAMLGQLEIPLARLMVLLGRPVGLSGALSATGALTCRADSPAALKKGCRFSGDATVRRIEAHVVTGARHPLVIDEIKAHVAMQPERLELGGLKAKLYGGSLSGTASVNRKTAVLKADIAAGGIIMRHLIEALSNEVSFSGRMEGATKFSMRLDEFERFPGNVQLTGDFHLRDGVLGKVDLQAAVGAGKMAANGGATRFDDLTGLLSVDATGYHFRKIKIVSGSLNATGYMDIDPALQLNGMLDADIRGTGGLASMPMAISGTLEQPVVRPGKAAMAGAAMGTMILGPGFGTAVGIKVGGFLNKLFGKVDDKADSKDAGASQPVKK